MKINAKMTELSNAIGDAQRAFRKMAFDTIKMLGGSVNVVGDDDCDEDEENKGLRVTFINNDGNAATIRIDRVFIEGDSLELFIHINEDGFKSTDYNYYLSELGDAADYVLEHIEWGDTETPDTPEETTTTDKFQLWDVGYEGGKVDKNIVSDKPMSTTKALKYFKKAVWVRGIR